MQGHRTASLFVLTFRFPVDTSLFRPTPLAGGMAMVFADDLFRPLRPGLRFFVFVFFLPFRDVGVGFEDPHLRLMLYLVQSGLPRFPPLIQHMRFIRVG